jgi:hypothetical protein
MMRSLPLHVARICSVLAVSLNISACAGAPKPPPPPKVVIKPVPVSCVPKGFPEAPTYPDTDAGLKAAPDGPSRFLMLGAGRVLRDQRLKETEAVIKACR